MPRVVFRLCGQPSGGPSGVRDQSLARMSAPSSPPPLQERRGRSTRAAIVARSSAGKLGAPSKEDVAHGARPVPAARRRHPSSPASRTGPAAGAPPRRPPRRRAGTSAEQIAAAVLAAPADRRAGAAVLGYDEKGALVTLREGTNDQICLADNPKENGVSVACYHKDLEPFMARGRALAAEGVKTADREDVRHKEIAAGTLKMAKEPRSLCVVTGTAFDARDRQDCGRLHAVGGLHAVRHAGIDRPVGDAGSRRAVADVPGQRHRPHHDQPAAAAEAVRPSRGCVRRTNAGRPAL